jgi:hypothetical protein
MLVGAVGNPNSGGIGRRLHIVYVSRIRCHYLARGFWRFSPGVCAAVLHRRCIGCSRLFFRWALRRKRRGGAGAIAAGPAAWSFSPTGRADVQAARRKVLGPFGPNQPIARLEPFRLRSWRLVSIGGFARSQYRKIPFLEKRPLTGSSQPVNEAAFRGAFASARSHRRAGRRMGNW